MGFAGVYPGGCSSLGFRVQDLGCLELLKGSWDLVTRVIIRVTILITPRYLQPYLLGPMILQVGD